VWTGHARTGHAPTSWHRQARTDKPQVVEARGRGACGRPRADEPATDEAVRGRAGTDEPPADEFPWASFRGRSQRTSRADDNPGRRERGCGRDVDLGGRGRAGGLPLTRYAPHRPICALGPPTGRLSVPWPLGLWEGRSGTASSHALLGEMAVEESMKHPGSELGEDVRAGRCHRREYPACCHQGHDDGDRGYEWV
jgi:hypothetical protein